MSKPETEDRSDAISLLKVFLQEICNDNREDGFIRRLAATNDRWSSVQNLLTKSEKIDLNQIAFESPTGFFSACNLKAHYILDEDFIDNGSAIVIFSLVGSAWNFSVRLANQNEITPAPKWLSGQNE